MIRIAFADRLLTRKHISFGKVVKGSFFSRGHTKSCTNWSCRLSHILSNSASMRSLEATLASLKTARMSLFDISSVSSAVLQSGNLASGDGLGAGVGGDAGADGRLLWGMVEVSGLQGVRIDRGLERPSMLLRCGLRVVEGKG